MINLNTNYLNKFITKNELESIEPEVTSAHEKLHSSEHSNFKGWLDLPVSYNKNELKHIKKIAEKIKLNTDVFIIIGIGGSYLGSRAAIEFLKLPSYNHTKKDTPDIFFAGNNLSASATRELLEICKDRDVSINVISKSGTTTEPAIAFRIFKEFLENKYGTNEAKKRIYCTTDKNEGILRKMVESEGYENFSIPSCIGGRYSVLTTAGLLPLSVTGIDVDKLLSGAASAKTDFLNPDLNKNNCYKYAAIRNILNRKGKMIELITGYEPRLQQLFEWWKQLFGESEGKNGKGIFPASAVFSTDLHSLGQFIQEGNKILFETTIFVNNNSYDIILKNDKNNLDGLNFLTGKSLNEINRIAFEATVLAHADGGVPNIVINVDDYSEYSLGYLFYFFEKACAISGYLLGVNPFDQPGVEAYKKNMFAFLGKPGYKI